MTNTETKVCYCQSPCLARAILTALEAQGFQARVDLSGNVYSNGPKDRTWEIAKSVTVG